MQLSPIDKLMKPIDSFMHRENTSGIILFVSLVISLIWVNSAFSHSYHEFWETPISLTIGSFLLTNSLHHWINDGLMTIFFFVVGLELKREFMAGELASPKRAILPLFAALGGMIVPATIYFILNPTGPGSSGWGIPMATDIAFAIGLLAFVNNKVPIGLKVFLTALAIADDLGAVLVIAFFYTAEVSFQNLGIAAFFLMILIGGNMLGIRQTLFYVVIGVVGIWLPFLLSGVHATIAGVLIAFVIPARTKINEEEYTDNIKKLNDQFRKEIPINTTLLSSNQHQILQEIKRTTLYAQTPLQKFEHQLHPWVAFFIMPVFALANSGMIIDGTFFSAFTNSVTLGVTFGLVAGKFLGVILFSLLIVKSGLASLPQNTNWKHMSGAALFAGIGFTMSLFIAGLAFTDPALIDLAKYGILTASAIAGISGILVFKYLIKKNPEHL